MKKEHIKDIFEKYKNGETSLEEEQFLHDNSSELDMPLSEWIANKKDHEIEVPENFNEKLWQSFDKKNKPKNKLITSILVAAASIVLLFSFFIKNEPENTQSLLEKQALLMEAKSMFSTPEPETNQKIIFENDLIVVYQKQNKN